MRVLTVAVNGLCLLSTAGPALAEGAEWSGPGWYAVLMGTETAEKEVVGGPFANSDTCLGYLHDHYLAKLTIPKATESDPEPEAEMQGWCNHYSREDLQDDTADFMPPAD